MLLSTFNQLRWQLKRRLPKQTVRIMKLVSVFLFICCIHATATMHGQKLSLKFENSSITKVLKEIRLQTGYNIVVEQNLLNKIGNVNIQVKNSSIENVLHLLFKDEGVGFSIQNKTITLKTTPVKVKSTTLNTLTVPEHAVFIFKGKVLSSEAGEPVVNASVYNNNTKKGTITKNDGTFEIDAVLEINW